MFNKEQKPEDFKDAETVIGESIQVNGDFKGEGNIIIEGTLSGSLQTKGSVLITDKAKISADISSKDAIINGEVSGNIHIYEQLTIGSSAKINGDIECGRIAVESGAMINGKILVSASIKNEQ
jgi:cytoskeletal protein CcmA (bactofilin family)